MRNKKAAKSVWIGVKEEKKNKVGGVARGQILVGFAVHSEKFGPNLSLL